MADTALEDRLLGHAKSFDGLLSLIPAKYYYGEDTSNQWKKKKQSKEQAAAAQRAKLDPDSIKSAKDIMDDRTRKRKLKEVEEFNGELEIEGIQRELPKQGLKLPNLNTGKKQKVLNKSNRFRPASYVKDARGMEKRGTKLDRKKEKKEKTKLKGQDKESEEYTSVEPETRVEQNSKELNPSIPEKIVMTKNTLTSEVQYISVVSQKEASSPASLRSPSPTFETLTEPSSNTSTSSVVPPAKAPKHIKLPDDPELLRSRLTARINALRAARKADGPDGRPARNRQELLEARRKKEEQRRAHKKQLRLKAKAEEEMKREATIASAGGSPEAKLRKATTLPPSDCLSFGRISFADGQQLTDDLSALRNIPRKRGPQDPGTALIASEKKRMKLAGLDENKRLELEEKDIWLTAKKHVYGEKIRDNPILLKKTLKRKEKAKKNSEKEWTERLDSVTKTQAMRQKKREENLKQRRDGKGHSRDRHIGGSNSTKSKKPKIKKRPGFEGSLISGKNKIVPKIN